MIQDAAEIYELVSANMPPDSALQNLLKVKEKHKAFGVELNQAIRTLTYHRNVDVARSQDLEPRDLISA